MRTTFLAVTLAILSVIWWPATVVVAQADKVARGTLSEISGSSITIQTRGESVTFSVDPKTEVEARGAGTKARQMAATGKPGPQLRDVLKMGQSVAVSYRETGGMPHASLVRVIPSAANGNKSATEPEMHSTGTVKAIGPDSITIVGATGGGASFTQTFHVSSATKVTGKGLGTATAAKGGKAPFTDLISAGDRVSVSYHKLGNTLQASDVRVSVKGSGSH